MLRKIIKGSGPEQKAGNASSADSPYSGINPDAFSTETDRTRTRVPFKNAQTWSIDDIAKAHTESEFQQKEQESESSIFSSLGLAVLVFIIVAGVGTYFLSNKKANELALGEGSSQEQAEQQVPQANAQTQSIASTVAQTKSEINEELIVSDQQASILDQTDEETYTEQPPASIGEFIAKATVNGVFMKGKKSRITINGRTYRVGEIVSEDFNLVFIGYHKDKERAVFQGPGDLYYLMSIR